MWYLKKKRDKLPHSDNIDIEARSESVLLTTLNVMLMSETECTVCHLVIVDQYLDLLLLHMYVSSSSHNYLHSRLCYW